MIMDPRGQSAAAPDVLSGVASSSPAAEHAQVVALARTASVEMTWHDADQLASCRPLLAPGTPVFVSHLPAQTWRQTIETCAAVRAHGFEPVPHLPVRRLAGVAAFEELVADLVSRAQVSRVLLIAGDAPEPVGPFSATLDALRSGVLAAHGIDRIFVAGHPEGHPQVADAELRRAERHKVAFAVAHDLELTFLTQFFFDAEPFLAWARRLRAEGVQARLVAGLAGPARLATLFRYAVRCGVGASIRALGSRPSLFGKLSGDRDPEPIVRAIARSAASGALDDIGIHLFSFGGLARTCGWLSALGGK
jgi:methylenetetrahydrofolate reductase (NADPH)